MANIIVAQPHGFCFGINRAIKIAQDTRQKYPDKGIYFFGELVHNQHVVDWLETELKIKTIHSIDEIPKNSVVILRAHVFPVIILRRIWLLTFNLITNWRIINS